MLYVTFGRKDAPSPPPEPAMSAESPGTADEIDAELDRLHSRLRLLVAFAEAQEAWEAEALNSDGPWFDRMPADLYDALMKLQALRNQALGR